MSVLLQFVLVTVSICLVLLLALNVAPVGWRTVVFNALSGLPLVGATVADVLAGFDWTKVLDGKAASWAGLCIVVINVVLRAMTSSPIGKSF